MTNFKKASIVSIVILLFIIGIAIASFGTNSGTVTKEAKLRKTASDDSIVLEIIPKKEEVEVIGEEGDWYQVRYNKIKGYVLKDYVDVVKVNETNAVEENNTIVNEPIEEIKEGSIVTLASETKAYVRPLINSKVIANFEKGKTVTVEEIRNGWLYVNNETVTGWIRLNTTTIVSDENNKEDNKEDTGLNKTAYISSSGINFREKPNTDSKVLKVFSENAKITIIEEQGEWYKIKHNDQVGYVIKTYVSDKKVTTTSRSSTTRTKTETAKTTSTTKATETKKVENTTSASETKTVATSSGKGQEVANYVKQFVGCRYVYGGSSTKGFDCSGLTMYVYKHFGVSLPHSATSQSKRGTTVSRANLQPGDLVFFRNFRTNKGIGHVGIYIGNNKFVHASTEKTGVITSTLTGTYNSRYVTATRMF